MSGLLTSGPNRWPIPSRGRDRLAAATAIVLVLLNVWPIGRSVRPVSPAIPAVKGATLAARDDSASIQTAAHIVDGNVFSATRRAPTVRFVPPGTDGATVQPSMPAMADGAMTDNGFAAPTEGPKLFGIIAQDGRRRALLQLPGTDSVPRLLDIGDRRGGYRVVSIADDRVVLATSTGSRTVRLVSRTSPDSLENLP